MSCWPSPRQPLRCAHDLLHRRPRPADRPLRDRRAVPLPGGRTGRAVAGGGGRRRRHPGIGQRRLWADRPRDAARRVERRGDGGGRSWPATSKPQVRQLGVVDAQGRAAAHTGTDTIPAGGHLVARRLHRAGQPAAQDTCWPAMAAAYEVGWPRGRHSWSGCCARWRPPRRRAATSEVASRRRSWSSTPSSSRPRWRGRLMDMRIEDHPDPVPELRRIVTLQLAYDLSTTRGRGEGGQQREERYAEARRMAPDAYELVFWSGARAATAAVTWRPPARAGDRLRRGRELAPHPGAPGRGRSRGHDPGAGGTAAG